MRALVCHELSGDRSGTRFEANWPEPDAPGSGEVTVAMTAASLNYPDLLMLSGGYQFKPALPFVPGVEGAGVIVIGIGRDEGGAAFDGFGGDDGSGSGRVHLGRVLHGTPGFGRAF